MRNIITSSIITLLALDFKDLKVIYLMTFIVFVMTKVEKKAYLQEKTENWNFRRITVTGFSFLWIMIIFAVCQVIFYAKDKIKYFRIIG